MLEATGPGQVWSWDITDLRSPWRGVSFKAYSIIDIYSRKLIGHRVEEREVDALAVEMFQDAFARHGVPDGVHADSGAAMRSNLLKDLLAEHGVTRTHNRPRVSNDNPFSESEFRTMKYRPNYPGIFDTLEQARAFMDNYVPWYNQNHKHSGIALFSPDEVHDGSWRHLWQHRERVQQAYYQAHPERFRDRPRTPMPAGLVGINLPAERAPPTTPRSLTQPGICDLRVKIASEPERVSVRGGIARWKRGQASQGVKQAIAYAFNGVCDSTLTAKTADGVLAAAGYADAVMTRYIVENGAIRDDLLTRPQLTRLGRWAGPAHPRTTWLRLRVAGRGPDSGCDDQRPEVVLDRRHARPRPRGRVRGSPGPAAGPDHQALADRAQRPPRQRRVRIREDLARIEVVELRHERSRSLDPHKHRHLWLNVKVQGQDGKWSNVDTRVALRFQNVINAEGDLASRTDPAWITALAAKGFTLNADGEIAQLQHLVRPLSKRSAQIEANKSRRTAVVEGPASRSGAVSRCAEPDRSVGVGRRSAEQTWPRRRGRLGRTCPR